jgi:glutaryl-CoA dehydrogenase
VTSLLNLDDQHSEEELQIRAVVRKLLDNEVRPNVAAWYEEGRVPVRDLARQFAKLGLLGMHLEGYGCAGASAVAYGLACLELEAADSGVRSLVSVQGSLAMFAIHRFGSEEQKQRWLPAMAAGEALGCFGLTEPDHGSDPGSMATRARRDGADWVLTGGKMWITNAPVADVAVIWARAEEGVVGFVVPMDTEGVSAREIKQKMSLRASSTGEIILDGVRLPADAQLPGARGLKAPLSCLSEARYGIVWGALGAARDCLDTTLDYARTREQFGRPIGGFQLSVGKLNNVRESLAIARQCRTILGANGISGEYPVLRHANNLESVLTYEGTSEIHQLVIGQKLTGQNAFS